MKLYILHTFCAFMLMAAAQVQAQPSSVEIKKISDYFSHNPLFECTAQAVRKCFDCQQADTLDYSLFCNLQPEDELFGAHFFYGYQYTNQAHRTWKYYDGAYIYVADTSRKVVTRFSVAKKDLRPILGSSDGVMPQLLYFFNSETIAKLLHAKDSSIYWSDTLIDAEKHHIRREIFPDNADFKNNFRSMLFSDQPPFLKEIYGSSQFLDQTQEDYFHFTSISPRSVDSFSLRQQFDSLTQGFAFIDYQHIVDTLPLGSKMPKVSGSFWTEDSISADIDMAGQIVILDFWFQSCLPCIQSIDPLNRLVQKYQDQIQIIGINPVDDRFTHQASLTEFISQHKPKYPLLFTDRNVAQSFKISSYPTLLIFDEQGLLVYRKVGFASAEDFFHDLDFLLGELIQKK